MAATGSDEKMYRLYTWGSGGNGALGHGNDDDVCLPKLLEGGGGFSCHAVDRSRVIVRTGGCHTLAGTAHHRTRCLLCFMRFCL